MLENNQSRPAGESKVVSKDKHVKLYEAVSGMDEVIIRAENLLKRISGTPEEARSERAGDGGPPPSLETVLTTGPEHIQEKCRKAISVLGEVEAALFS